jgi:hypothetical protein
MNDGWYIPHPGTGEALSVDNFEVAMDRWFEGYNLPFRVDQGEREDFSVSYARVTAYYAKPQSQPGSAPPGPRSGQPGSPESPASSHSQGGDSLDEDPAK